MIDPGSGVWLGERRLPGYDGWMPTEHETLSDLELIQLINRRGVVDERPFSLLFQRHQAMVWNVCYRFMRSEADAEDLLQEVFLKAYQGLPAFAGRSQFSTWLYRIAVNTCLNELRKRERRKLDLEILLDSLPPQQQPASADALNGHAFHAHERLEGVFSTLKPEAREVLRLRDLEGRSYAEIAARLGIKLSAAKMRVQRARLALVTAISEAQE